MPAVSEGFDGLRNPAPSLMLWNSYPGASMRIAIKSSFFMAVSLSRFAFSFSNSMILPFEGKTSQKEKSTRQKPKKRPAEAGRKREIKLWEPE